jgi:drug/metabolite transporter (DMT)-like permease
MEWYLFALLAFGLYTTQGLIFKIAADRRCDNNLTTFYFLLTTSIIAIPVILLYGISIVTIFGLVIAIVNGIFYSIQIITRIGALKHIKASIAYSILRLNTAVVVILFILFLGEVITIQNFIGIVLSIMAIYLLSKGEKSEKRV